MSDFLKTDCIMGPIFESSSEEARLHTCCMLIFSVCTNTLRKYLSFQMSDRVDILRKKIHEHEAELRNTFTKKQTEKIFVQKKTSFGDLDFSLIYTLLRNLCSFSVSGCNWGDTPKDGDNSIIACCERIREMRNDMVHMTMSEINIKDLENYADKAKIVIKAIEKNMSKRYSEQGSEFLKSIDFYMQRKTDCNGTISMELLAKGKLAEMKRPKTGGGPKPPSPSPAEQSILDNMDGRPSLEGIVGGTDTSEQVPDASESQGPSLAGEKTTDKVTEGMRGALEIKRERIDTLEDKVDELEKRLEVCNADRTQAQALATVVYRLVKRAPKKAWHGDNRFTLDIAYTGKGDVAISDVNVRRDATSEGFLRGLMNIRWHFTQGSYLSSNKVGSILLLSQGEALQCMRIASKSASSTFEKTEKLYQKTGYIPHGTAICKTGTILVCLWNQSYGEKSHGLVLKINFAGKVIFTIESNKSRRLFTCPTYVAENGNEDVCVSDVDEVVVTDKVGMLRFRYTGRQFDPYGICCDCNRNIIIADMKNDKIHMIDENGEFLHYIQYKEMKMPRALCIDENDKLYVGEWNCDDIKVISRQ